MSWFKQDPMDTVESAMKRQHWKHDRIDAWTIISGFSIGDRACLVTIRHEEEKKAVLLLFHPAPSITDVLKSVMTGRQMFIRVHTAAGYTKEQVTQICELLLTDNYRLVLGAFERDQSDGELRFRIALPYHGTSLSAEQVTWCLQIGLASVEVGMQKIDAVLGGEKAAPRMEV